MATWSHPELGDFKLGYTGWARDFMLPAFEPFRYGWGGRLRTRKKFTLEFDVDDEAEDNGPVPSKRAVAVAQRALQNQDLLAARITKAVWNDLNGRGRDTGMWWHGDTRTINEQIASVFGGRKGKPQSLSSINDLYLLLGLNGIRIRETSYMCERPNASINFAAAFDDEHGVGVLSDGTPFAWHRVCF